MKHFIKTPGDVLLLVVFLKVVLEPFNPWSVAALGVSALIAYWNREQHRDEQRADEQRSRHVQELEERSRILEGLKDRFEKLLLRFEEVETIVKDKNTTNVFGGRR